MYPLQLHLSVLCCVSQRGSYLHEVFHGPPKPREGLVLNDIETGQSVIKMTGPQWSVCVHVCGGAQEGQRGFLHLLELKLAFVSQTE